MDVSRRSIRRLIGREVPKREVPIMHQVHAKLWASMHQVPPFFVGPARKIIRGIIAIPELIFCIRGKVVNLY